MALVDLRFTDESSRKKFTCAHCPATVMAGRRCQEPGFENLKSPMKVDETGGQGYSFCPGKATWSAHAAELFMQCRLAMETGILPGGPNLDEQDAYFVATLPAFVDRWRERTYRRIWNDVSDFTGAVLKAIFPK